MYSVYVYYIKHFAQFHWRDDYKDYTDFVVTSVMITNIELSIRELSSIVTVKLSQKYHLFDEIPLDVQIQYLCYYVSDKMHRDIK